VSLRCRFKPATEGTDSDSKYLTGLDSSLEVDVSLCMVCDEEVISAGTNNTCSIGTSPVRKLDSSEKVDICEKVGLPGKPGRTVIRKVNPVHLSRFELEGLKAVVEWLEGLPVGKRNVPKDLPEPDALLNDVRVSRISLFDSDDVDINIDSTIWTTVVILEIARSKVCCLP